MSRCVVSVASGPFVKGQERLSTACRQLGERIITWGSVPNHWPRHNSRPYAFKAYAMIGAANIQYRQILWCDACMVPIQPLKPIWDYAREHGVWLSRNGWTNYEWTAESAYADLFPTMSLARARELNRTIPHVVAGAIAVDLDHSAGRAFLEQYFHLASQTNAFCGPWINAKAPGAPTADGVRCAICGPADVLGHRHDQTAASVIAWKLSIPLTDPPRFFAYGKLGEPTHPETILLADGAY